ncbi:sugar ABC transporter substrate-binding protein [Streptomyces sp. NPDC059534]|uniref:sugar ABC transporter substrate-binding protein n=1 Tax=Streptomyces sp. NPDC059534 TaxID=3346859 RepID=UPI00367846EC
MFPTSRSRAVAAAAAGAVLVMTCGCGGGSGSGSGDTVTVTVGFVNGAHSDFHTCLQGAVEMAAEVAGAELTTANSQQDPARELAHIKAMVSQDVDVLIVQTVDAEKLKDGIAVARGANVPIFLTSVVGDDTADILGAVVVDLKKAGRLDAGWVGSDAGGRQVEVGVIAGAPGAASDLLVSGFTEALPPNAKVVVNAPAMFDPVKAEGVATRAIRAHPGLDYVFVANEERALAARDAFDATGAKGVKIVTINGTHRGLAAIKDGRVSATVTNSPLTNGRMAVKNALTLLSDEPAPKIATVPLTLVTRKNLDHAPPCCP